MLFVPTRNKLNGGQNCLPTLHLLFQCDTDVTPKQTIADRATIHTPKNK